MKSTRFLSLLLALMLALSFGALAESQPALVLTDMVGREVTLEKPAAKVVVLQPADVEILYLLGAGETLVGRGEYANYPEQALAVPSVQSGFETNYEQIIALQPDVVVMAKMSQREEDIKKLEEAGIKVVVTDAQDIQGVYNAIALLGKLTGTDETAATLVKGMQDAFAELLKKVDGKQAGSIYFEVSPLQWGLWAAGTGTFMDEIGTMLGLSNAFNDLEGWKEVSEEQVLARDPDFIVTTAMYFGEGPTPVEELLGRANWAELKAVKNNKVFNADGDAITRPGPRLVEAAQALYTFVYGE